MLFTDRGVRHVKGVRLPYAELRGMHFEVERKGSVLLGRDGDPENLSWKVSPEIADELADLSSSSNSSGRRSISRRRALLS